MVCLSCGKAAPPQARFCGDCGTRLPTAAAVLPRAAGRRQLTVVFCDLVDSTRMADRMDPEDFREVLLAYRDCCTASFAAHHGHVAGFVGDGVLGHFGLPVAREDDARLAVQAGLDICERVAELARSVQARHSVRLAVRVGIHTGLVVVDEAPPGQARSGSGIIGQSLNIGARVEAHAAPNNVVISRSTFDIVRGHFVVESLGARTLKGVAQPMELFRVIASSSARSLFEARAAIGLSPLVSRTAELAMLAQEWTRAAAGTPRSLLISGEPGIGKSRLLHEFQNRIAPQSAVQITCSCIFQYRNTAFYPIAVELARLCGIDGRDDAARRREKLRVALARYNLADGQADERIAAIFPDPDDAATAPRAQAAGAALRQQTIEAITRFVAAAAGHVPLLLLFEDLHWADPSTLDLLRHLCRDLHEVPVLLLATVREGTGVDIGAGGHLGLRRITGADCRSLVQAIAADNQFTRAVLDELVERSDGVPLFVEELTRAVLERLDPAEHARADDSHDALVPATLRDSLMARLDRLGPAKEVAQAAAAIGRSFRADLLSSLAMPDLDAAIALLLQHNLIFRKAAARAGADDDTFEFKHELVRSIAYDSLLRAERQAIHRRIAEALAGRFADDSGRHPELLAHHYTRAGLAAQALPLWAQAGRRATRNSANLEAIAHFTRALRLLESLPPSEARDATEFDLQLGLAAPLMATRGYGSPELEQALARALELTPRIGDSLRAFPLWYGRWSYQQVTGKLVQSLDLARRLVALTEDQQAGAEHRMVAWRLLGTSLQVAGDPAASLDPLHRALGLFDADQHTRLAYLYGADLQAMTLCTLALAQWTLGHHRSAATSIATAKWRAENLGHANTRAYVQSYQLAVRAIDGDVAGFEAELDAHSALAAEQRLPVWQAAARSFAGWLALRRDDLAGAELSLRQSLDEMRTINLVYWQPMAWMWLGETLGLQGRWTEAEAAFAEAHQIIAESHERWAEPELYRLWAATRRRAGRGDAPDLLRRALRTAERQQALGWSLRICRDIVRLPEAGALAGQVRDILARVPDHEAGRDCAALRDWLGPQAAPREAVGA